MRGWHFFFSPNQDKELPNLIRASSPLLLGICGELHQGQEVGVAFFFWYFLLIQILTFINSAMAYPYFHAVWNTLETKRNSQKSFDWTEMALNFLVHLSMSSISPQWFWQALHCCNNFSTTWAICSPASNHVVIPPSLSYPRMTLTIRYSVGDSSKLSWSAECWSYLPIL